MDAGRIPSTNDMSICTIAHAPRMFLIAGQRNQVADALAVARRGTWTPTPLPVPPGTEGMAVVIREAGGQVVVFGYVMEDAGNGGSWPVAHRLDPGP